MPPSLVADKARLVPTFCSPLSLVADKARLVPTFCAPLSLVADKARLVPTFCAAVSLVIVSTLLFFHFFVVKGLSCQEKVVNLKNN